MCNIPLAATVIEKLPSISETTPFEVPFSKMVAPIIDSPAASLTEPEILIVFLSLEACCTPATEV